MLHHSILDVFSSLTDLRRWQVFNLWNPQVVFLWDYIGVWFSFTDFLCEDARETSAKDKYLVSMSEIRMFIVIGTSTMTLAAIPVWDLYLLEKTNI